MLIYFLILFVLFIEICFFELSNFKKPKLKLFFFIFTIAFLILVTGLRSYNVGHDTANYRNIYLGIRTLSFKDAIDGTIQAYSSLEIGYTVLSWTFSRLTRNFTYFLLFVALIQYTFIALWIWKNSKKPFLCLFVFFCMFYTFFLTGLRQGLALSILLFSFEFVKKRKIIPFLITVFVATLFHTSSLIFALAYFVPLVSKNIKIATFLFFLFWALFYFIRQPIYSALLPLSGKYSGYQMMSAGEPINYTLMLLLISAGSVALLFLSPIQDIQEKSTYNTYVVYILISLCIMPFVGLNPNLLRIAMYFSIFVCLLMEHIYGRFKDNGLRLAIGFLSLTVLVVLFLNELSNSSYLYSFVGFSNLKG